MCWKRRWRGWPPIPREPTGTDIYYAPSKEFDQFVRSEIERFREIIRISGAKPD
jgi:hypothetical protein